MSETHRRLQGLRALLVDAVAHGASAIEKVHLATAARPFTVLERIAPVAAPAALVRVVHDATTSAVYATIRGVTRAAGVALELTIDAAVPREAADGDPDAADRAPPPPPR
jgi:hypothetical protein